jgi:copper resistance protein B
MTCAWRLAVLLSICPLSISAVALADEGGSPGMAPAQMQASMDMNDASRFGQLLVDQLEWRDGGGGRSGVWDAQGGYGGDYDKLWVKTEGEWPSGAGAQGRAELLWDRIVASWWRLQSGGRYDFGSGPGKGWAAIGIQGLAPYWIDVEATLYAGSGGTLAGRFKAESDLRFTQRLILQPELELNGYSRADRPRLQAAGLADVDAGLRLRYEIQREMAPYLGLAWTRRSGEMGGELHGELHGELQWLAGVRFRY